MTHLVFNEVSDDTSPTLGGDLACGGNKVSNLEMARFRETLVDKESPTTGSTVTIDLSTDGANAFKVSLPSSGAITFAFSNFSSGLHSFALAITTDGTCSVTWPAALEGDAPDLSADAVHILTFVSIDSGTKVYWARYV